MNNDRMVKLLVCRGPVECYLKILTVFVEFLESSFFLQKYILEIRPIKVLKQDIVIIK